MLGSALPTPTGDCPGRRPSCWATPLILNPKRFVLDAVRCTPTSTTAAARTVLLVEDIDEVAAATGELIRSFGWAVEHASDAEMALEMIDRGIALDVVLADIAMPGAFDGAELAVGGRRGPGGGARRDPDLLLNKKYLLKKILYE